MFLRYCLAVDDEQIARSASNGRSALAEKLGLHRRQDAKLQQLSSLSWLPPLREHWFNGAGGWFEKAPYAWFEKLNSLPAVEYGENDPRCFVTAQLAFSNRDHLKEVYHDLLKKRLNRFRFGSDPKITDLEIWSPIGPGGGIFGDRASADALAGVRAFEDERATGKGVNVVIVDRGLDRNWVEGTIARMSARRGLGIKRGESTDVHGWTRILWEGAPDESTPRFIHPGTTGSEHGHMVARNVLAIAPAATIWDAPLLPPENEPDAPPSPSVASALYYWISQCVRKGTMLTFDSNSGRALQVPTTGPWIIVNAWGVLDTSSDSDLSQYAEDPDHFLVNDMEGLGDIDVVFAAGNCGEPCPDLRCGSQDCGPGRSILGLNAHPEVLTVGAVRVDGLPVAFSAQGPGRLARRGSKGDRDYTENLEAKHKPDLCAPSHFRENDNAAEVNTGTSAACGFAAGVLAALRSMPECRSLTPRDLRNLLRKTAQRPNAVEKGWDSRLGFGIINAERAVQLLKHPLSYNAD